MVNILTRVPDELLSGFEETLTAEERKKFEDKGYICPMVFEIIKEPVRLIYQGGIHYKANTLSKNVFDKGPITEWLKQKMTDPLNRESVKGERVYNYSTSKYENNCSQSIQADPDAVQDIIRLIIEVKCARRGLNLFEMISSLEVEIKGLQKEVKDLKKARILPSYQEFKQFCAGIPKSMANLFSKLGKGCKSIYTNKKLRTVIKVGCIIALAAAGLAAVTIVGYKATIIGYKASTKVVDKIAVIPKKALEACKALLNSKQSSVGIATSVAKTSLLAK
ncbi:U-box domain-containing protein [Rickettsiales endosymbiont of Stachyamoeba lipophora]|uniref:U-box domain-containing protein n=1 Tax=Rickettsiales endosymbiont of Stachyamoeba lipophora TaxID=2486578 RepID=UPI000F64567E|nr:hypothetical protein [Rickettsiales endosymbiont of Stachyamoeba lipophora]AZL15336.1 hypothetical protein EF513_02040 [Rickettsiales endosymbiont of Stachyamoeba lipophora]